MEFDEKTGCLAVGVGALVSFWLVGHALTSFTEDWKPVARKCSIELSNRYEAIKEYRLKQKVEEEEAKIAKEKRVELAQSEEATQQARVVAEKKKADKIAAREEQIKAFAEKEAGTLWKTLQLLRGEIELQEKRIYNLKKVLEDFDRDPKTDEDFQGICKMRDALVTSVTEIKAKLEDAYIAAKKFEATPGQDEYDEIRRRALEDGVQEADAAIKRFNLMREKK